MNRKDYNLSELKKILDYKIVGIVCAVKPLAYDGDWNEYLGLKIYNPITKESYIFWLIDDSIGNFVIENFDTAEDFEEV